MSTERAQDGYSGKCHRSWLESGDKRNKPAEGTRPEPMTLQPSMQLPLVALRSPGPGAEKGDGGVYLQLKSGKVGTEEGHKNKGRKVTAVTNCRYSSCKAGRCLGPEDTKAVKMRIKRKAENVYGEGGEGEEF